MNDNHNHGNRTRQRVTPREHIPVVKVPASSVPYGESISRNGRTVCAVYDGDRLVAVGATADEARRKYREFQAREAKEGNRQKS